MAKTIFFSYVSVHLYPCGRVYRYPGSSGYHTIFKWMQAHVVTITFVCVFLIAIADALRMFAKIADGMEKVQMSVSKMYSDKNELIELPKQFTELERQMNQEPDIPEDARKNTLISH